MIRTQISLDKDEYDLAKVAAAALEFRSRNLFAGLCGSDYPFVKKAHG